MRQKTLSNIIKFEDLPKVRKLFRDKRIVYCAGCFDLTHAGHVLFFEDCKKLGDILVVSVGSDATIKKYKEGRPVLNQHLRLKMVSSLKPVNYCFIQSSIPFDDPASLLDVVDLDLRQLKPDFYVINDDAYNIPRRKEILKKHPNITMHILKRTAPKKFGSVSTTSLIKRIRQLK